jgi:hypothetical protein
VIGIRKMVGSIKTSALRYVYQHHISGRIAVLAVPKQAVILDFTDSPVSRFGHGAPPHSELGELIGRGAGAYRNILHEIVATSRPGLQAIAREDASDIEPTFHNELFSGLDAAALYGFLCRLNPRTYLEVGSGNSTRFARRAINDNGLRTKIISVDPAPRVEIDRLCDEIIREPLEDIDLHGVVLEALQAGDILFVDGSHRCFTNSDVTILFLEILSRLAPGVIVHLHDILLPYDYPPVWRRKYYSEQYLLACWLLGGGRHLEIMLPCAFVSSEAELRAVTEPLWDTPEMRRVLEHSLQMYHGYLGYSFWLRATD